MSRQLRNLFASMEEQDINETDIVVSPDETLEEEVAEVAESSSEVEEIADTQDELEDIQEGLEAIAISLESAIADGGLDSQAATFMQLAVDSYTTRLGMGASAVVPSMESFGGASGRVAATTISLEGIKETIEKIWQAIKNAVAKAIEAVKNFFAKIFGGVEKLKTRSKALREQLSKGDVKKGKIKVTSANALKYQGKVDGASVVTGLTNLASVGNVVMNELVTGAKTYYDRAQSQVLNSESLKSTQENWVEEKISKISSDWDTVASKVTKTTKAMSGDAVFKSEGGSTNGIERGNAMAVPNLVKNFFGKDIAEGQEVDAPDAGTLGKILDQVDAVIDTMEKKSSTLEALNKARTDAVAQSDKFVATIKSGKVDGVVKSAKVSLALRSVNRDLTRPVTQYTSHAFSVVRAALAYVDRAIGGGSDKKDEKK